MMGFYVAGPNNIVGAGLWLKDALVGSLASTIAVLAVAAAGAAMLRGTIGVGRGVKVILGCFILFGAPAIAAGLIDLRDKAGDAVAATTLSPVQNAPSAPPPIDFDPYSGAAVSPPR